MHEISIAKSLLEMLNDQQRTIAFSRIKRARVKIGTMSGVDGSALRFAFDLISKGTCADGCLLEVATTPLLARCTHCGSEFEINGCILACHSCQSRDIELLGGNDIVLSEIEVEMSGEGICPN